MAPNPRTFQLLSCIGEGGFGEVYRAAMRSAGGLEREVAVKTLKPAVALDGEALARLQDEARLLARLDHRSILAVHDLVRLGDRVALVTELLRGQDLKALLVGGEPLPDRVIAAILGEVAGALAAASDRLSLVHRDIKPSNIHVGEDGTVKLLDFGIARSPKVERDGHTGTGLIVGTFGYLAPERVSDESHGAPSDVYSLGCVLFAALTREPLYERQSRSDVLRISLDDSRHDAFVAERLARAPAGPLRELLARMLAYAPDDRPTAHEVELGCEDLAASLPGPTLRQWARGRRWPPLPSNAGALLGQTLSEAPLDEAPAPLESTTWAEPPDPGPRAAAPAPTLAFRPAPEAPRAASLFRRRR